MSVLRRAIIFFFFTVFSFAILSLSPSHAVGLTSITGEITNPATWTKEGSPYKVSGNVVVKAPLTIEAGTIVKFGTSGLDGFKIQNDFFVKGTREEPVVFTSIRDDEYGGDTNGDGSRTKPTVGSWSQIMFNPAKDHELKIKYAKIFYANMGVSFYPSAGQTKDISIKKSEIRKNGIGINISNAEATIESNIISENADYGISAKVSTKKPKAINNSITNNSVGARGVNSSNPSQIALEAKYNWWGSKSGPYNEIINPDGSGNPAAGQVSFDSWTREDPIETPDPVIIVPGAMGSWKKDGVWNIDPIFHTYDNLCEEFLANGYEKGKNFSVFPYEWRDSNAENAKLLHKRIQDIKNETGRPKVDIVAHSMGGILSREYIESDYFEDDVDQLITVATPHLGAPKVYVKWEAGAFFSDIFEMAGRHFFNQEAKENGYDSIFHYIRGRPMTSARELLPVYDYLYDDNGTDYDLRNTYPSNYPRNEFLENLNDVEKVKVLEKVEFTKIIGKQDRPKTTISGYNVINADMRDLWEHGYPHGFEIPKLGDQGIKKDYGDETVPLYSAEALEISDNKKMYLQSEHNILPSDAQKDILEILTGKRPESEVNEWRIDDILIGMVFSPVDFQIVSPSGKRMGKNFETGGEYSEIEGAFYTGFNTNSEFLTIPNPEDGEYKILTQGTGTGEYEVEIAKISKNDEDEAEESTETIIGTAEPKKQEETIVKIEGMKVEKISVPGPEGENDDNQNDSSEKNSFRQGQNSLQKLDVLKGQVLQYFKTGEIKTRKEAKIITKKLNHIRVHLKKYETEKSPKKLPASKKKTNRHINRLISLLEKHSPKKITKEAKDYMVGILEELKID